MFTFGWFSSGRDQAAIDLFTVALDHLEKGFIKGRLAYVFYDRAPGETPASEASTSPARWKNSWRNKTILAAYDLNFGGGPGSLAPYPPSKPPSQPR